MSPEDRQTLGTRLLYSSDGLLYVTADHYVTASSVGRWK